MCNSRRTYLYGWHAELNETYTAVMTHAVLVYK